MSRFVHMILVLSAAVLLAPGNGGLRALHLVAEAGHVERHDGCGHDHHEHGHDAQDEGDKDEGAHDEGAHDELTCSTCELLLALGTLLPTDIPAPTFHALVAVADDGAPVACPAPAPMRAISARPPPSR